MNRRALLIDAGRACPGEIIDGCRSDVLQLKAWLESSPGGAWDEAPEIWAMHNATLGSLDIGVSWMNGADFAFLAFSGHGEIHEVDGKRSQKVYVGNGTCELIDFSRLKPTTGKSVILCDACRKVHVKGPIVKSFSEGMVKYGRAAARKERATREDYKREHLRLLDKADGRYTMYSCSANQVSGENEDDGGRFTSALLTCAREWYADAKPLEYVTIGTMFGQASPIVSATSREQDARYPQDPEAYSSLRGVSSEYPFAIHLD